MFTPNHFASVRFRARKKKRENQYWDAQSSHWRPRSNTTPYRNRSAFHATSNRSTPRPPKPRPYLHNSMSNPWPNSLPIPIPRSFPELQTERSYLLNALNRENVRATDLLRRIPPLEESIISDDSSAKRKIRKQLGWLKYRLEETNRQEQIILQRLGQLTWEIQQRERWTLLEDERRMRDQGLWYRMQGLRLNAAVPEFEPQNQWQAPGAHWERMQWEQQRQPVDYFGYDWKSERHNFASELPANDTGQDENETLSPMESLPIVQVCNIPQHPGEENMKRPELWHRSSSLSAASLDLMATNEGYMVTSRVKRNSLPTLPGIANFWGQTKEDAEEKERRKCGDEGYFGYYVKE